MRIATWNVNSIRTRAPLVLDFLRRADIDVLAMQEIKCRPDQFPSQLFADAGYELAIHGFNQWNGVAFASRLGLSDITPAFPGQPGFGNPIKGQERAQLTGPNGLPQEARALGVTVRGLRLWSLYVPNGRGLDDPHFSYKLDWLSALHTETEQLLRQDSALPLALMGDFNIAPTRADMGDPSFVEGQSTHVSQPERELFARFAGRSPHAPGSQSSDPAAAAGLLQDVVRPYAPAGYTYWDYRTNKFEYDQGMRIDFILGSAAFADAVTGAYIARDERAERGAIKPSDHVPVVCELDLTLLEEDFDADADAPMIW